MSEHTTCKQRILFYERHSEGETYEEIARAMGVSRECVRYWCRRQRAGRGVHSQYQRKPSGLLSRFCTTSPFGPPAFAVGTSALGSGSDSACSLSESCVAWTTIAQSGSNWTLSSSMGAVSSQATTADRTSTSETTSTCA